MTLKHFWIALQFLTRLPAPAQTDIEPVDLGRSVVAYPLVGLVIGFLLLVVAGLTSGLTPWLSAALILTVWVVVTGALHLDGLADSADAWLGGYGDKEKTMAIMKDPYCGPAGVISLVLVLLLKWVLLVALLDSGEWLLLLLAPVLSRGVVLALMIWTPYARADGIGYQHSGHLPQQAGIWMLVAVVMTSLVLGGGSAIFAILVLLGVFYLLRRVMMERLGGTTGDTAGALIEMSEVVLLLAWLI